MYRCILLPARRVARGRANALPLLSPFGSEGSGGVGNAATKAMAVISAASGSTTFVALEKYDRPWLRIVCGGASLLVAASVGFLTFFKFSERAEAPHLPDRVHRWAHREIP